MLRINCLLAATVLLFSSTDYAKAADVMIDSQTGPILKAEVILTQPKIQTRIPVGEKELPTYGCTFTTTDSDKIKDLVKIIKKNLVEKSNNPSEFTLRNIIYLHSSNALVTKFLFSDLRAVDKLVHGVKSSINSQNPVLIQGGIKLLPELRAWSSSVVDRKASNPSVCEFN